jgi:hypothetical protein
MYRFTVIEEQSKPFHVSCKCFSCCPAGLRMSGLMVFWIAELTLFISLRSHFRDEENGKFIVCGRYLGEHEG